MAKRTQAEKEADRAARRAFKLEKQQQRQDAKRVRQEQRQTRSMTNVGTRQGSRTDRTDLKQAGKSDRTFVRQGGRTARTEFRQNPENVANRQRTMRGLFDNISALGGDITDAVTSGQQIQAFNENPEDYASAFGIGSGQTPAPSSMAVETTGGGIMDEPWFIPAAAGAALGGLYLVTRGKK